MAKVRRSRQIARRACNSHDRDLPNGVGVPGTMRGVGLMGPVAAITARYSMAINRLAARL